MLLTNQKTINYENLSKNLRKPLPYFFDGAKIPYVIALFQVIYQL